MPGQERFVVVLTIDMRNSTRLAETRLPFDAVFIVDRFVTAASSAVEAHGGRVSHFLGDGLMAAFGLACGPRQACLQSLLALIAFGSKVEALNRVLIAETGEALHFGVGIHCGQVIVGEIGSGAMRTFTTLGDAANVASRLEGLCKGFGCEAVISNDVWRIAGLPPDALPSRQATLRGRSATLLVHPVERVEALAVLVPMRAAADG
jgi:adenylate cyclase